MTMNGYPEDVYFMMLVRKLAERHSQLEIAQVLNERGLLRPDGQAWQQFSVSRYCAAHGIKPAKEWRRHTSSSNNNKKVSDESNTSYATY